MTSVSTEDQIHQSCAEKACHDPVFPKLTAGQSRLPGLLTPITIFHFKNVYDCLGLSHKPHIVDLQCWFSHLSDWQETHQGSGLQWWRDFCENPDWLVKNPCILVNVWEQNNRCKNRPAQWSVCSWKQIPEKCPRDATTAADGKMCIQIFGVRNQIKHLMCNVLVRWNSHQNWIFCSPVWHQDLFCFYFRAHVLFISNKYKT